MKTVLDWWERKFMERLVEAVREDNKKLAWIIAEEIARIRRMKKYA